MGHQHTPGPWKANICVGGAFEVISESQKYVAPGMVVASRNGYPGWGLAEESAANGHLIAAAPELLESLKAMLEHYGPDKSIARLCNYSAGHPITKAREAIAKAKGEMA